MAIDWENVVDHAGRGLSNYRHNAKTSVKPIENRHGNTEESMQGAWRHAMRDLPILVAESVPLVVPAVEPNSERTARFQVLRQNLNRLFTIGRVMEHAHAVDAVECSGREGKGEDIGLESNEITIREILRGNFRGSTEVDSYDARAPAGGDLGEASHAAAYVEDELPLQVLRPEASFIDEILL